MESEGGNESDNKRSEGGRKKGEIKIWSELVAAKI